MTRVCMISGHLDLTDAEFREHYEPLIDQAIEEGCDFVVGDARGADKHAQALLATKVWRGFSVTVYHMYISPRNNVGGFETKDGYTKDDGKDAAMTEDSDFDIAWVRPEKHSSVSGRVSGTEQNIIRRKAKGLSK